MKWLGAVRINLLGYEILTIELFGLDRTEDRLTAIDKGVKGITRHWVDRMNK